MKQIPRKTWDNYINKLSRIDKTAGKKVQAFISKNGIPATAAETSRLIDYSYGLVQTYGSASAALACEMYDSLSRIEGAKVPPAEPAELATYGETAKAINGTLKNSIEAALVPGAVERLTKMAGADTMLKNAIRDGAEWAWIPNGDTCVFCLTLASRGWQPASKAVLDGGHAEHIHAHCDCTFMIRHDSNMNVQGYDPDKLREEYYSHNGDLNEWRREIREQNKDRINAQKRAAYAEKVLKDKKSDVKMPLSKEGSFIVKEESLRTKSGGEYGVDWKIVKSKEYSDKFSAISDNQKANELAAQRARNALVNRNNKKTEELYAISLTKGTDISKITDQDIDFGVKRTDKFNADIKRAVDNGEKILFIHNHPRGLPPSITDINELINSGDAVGITVGHDGSVFLYGKPSSIIRETDERVAAMKLPWYSGDVKEYQTMVLEELSKTFGFRFDEL